MRIVWIIDAEYLLKAAPGPFDYLKLKKHIERELGETIHDGYFLNSAPYHKSDAQEGFYTWLKSAAPYGPKLKVKLYRLRNVRCKCPDCGEWFDRNVQSGVDVGIATLLTKLAMLDQYDRVLLSVGDGEYHEVLDFVKADMNKEVWLCGFDGTINPDIQCHVDSVLWLDDGWDGYKKGERRRRDDDDDEYEEYEDDDEYEDDEE